MMIKIKDITIILLLSLLVGCVSSGEDKTAADDFADDTTDVADDDSAVDANDDDSAVDANDDDSGDDDSGTDSGDDDSTGSSIHGGSPTPVTWTECDQWPGSNPCDFSLEDQYGDTFTLYDNYDTVMVLDFSTMWCSVCKNIAPDVQTYQDTYGPQGFLWVTILVEDAQGNDPDSEDIINWSSTYGIVDSPVLAGNRADFVDLSGTTGYPISAWPTFVVIDRGMVLTNGINGWNEDTVLGWAEDAL